MAYPPPAYGPPGQQPYGAAPQNGFGLTSMILGIVSIPISAATESLNAGIAASVTLYEIAKLRAAR